MLKKKEYVIVQAPLAQITRKSLRDFPKPIGVSEYRVTHELPTELEKQLPSIEDIQSRIGRKGDLSE